MLKALFKIKAKELTFTGDIEVAIETEDAAEVTKETVYGSHSSTVQKMSAKSHRKEVYHKGQSMDVTARSKDLFELPQQRAC